MTPFTLKITLNCLPFQSSSAHLKLIFNSNLIESLAKFHRLDNLQNLQIVFIIIIIIVSIMYI